MIINAHLNWFKLKVPYQANTPEYQAAYANLEKIRAEFENYDDGSLKVKHYCICENGSPPLAIL